MTEFHYADILVAPVISEKSNTLMIDQDKYIFVISHKATKQDVQRAVHERFKVDVASVNIINLPGKPKKVGKYRFKKGVRRKAIVKLMEGQIINDLREAI